MDKLKWSLAWPTKPGCYWFCGYRYVDKRKMTAGNTLEMCLVKVKQARNGIVFVADGEFLYFEESFGWFTPAQLPEMPEEACKFHGALG